MNSVLSKVVLSMAVALSFGWASTGIVRAADDGEKIIAIVNDEVITLKDLKAYVAGMRGQLRVENTDPFEMDEIMRQYQDKGINQLIEDKLILAAAKDKEVEVKQQAIDKRIQEIKDSYPSEDVFQIMLESGGMTITDIRNKIGDQMKAKFMVDREVRSKIFVNPQEVTDYYNKHKNDFVKKAYVNLDSIFVSFDKGRDQAKARAQEARKLLTEGKSFAEVFKDYSDLPSVGTIEEGQLKPEIEDKVFAMKEGEISEPFEVENGLYVFRFNRKSDREIEPLKNAKEAIYNKIFDEKFRKKFEDWIAKLRQKVYVEIRQ
jgi:parvulin-like peptidyl-prolyl isomerase